MKKRSAVLALVLAMVMMLTACGSKSLDGSWRGTWDMSEALQEVLESSGMEGEFSGLTVDLIFTFDEEDEEIEMEIDEDSLEAMAEKLQEQMYDVIDAYIEDMADEWGYTVDELCELYGYDSRSEMVEDYVGMMGMDDLTSDLADELKVEGEYEYDEEDGELVAEFENGEEVEMEVSFEGKTLMLEFELDGVKVELECQKEK